MGTPRWALAALLLSACQPAVERPVKAMVLALTSGSGGTAGGSYDARQVELRTLEDPVAVLGEVAEFIGGARIVLDGRDPILQQGNFTDDQLREVFVKAKGRAPRASYVEKDGVLWPADFHSWNLITAYYNLERAFDYFRAQGVIPGAALEGNTVYYFPSYQTPDSGPETLRDNILYLPPVRALLILPFEGLQEVPLALNAGVAAHEFAHRVFNLAVYGNAAVPLPIARWIGLGGASPQVNLMKAVDEGLADFHAVAATCRSDFGCNTRFIESSVDKATADARDIARTDHCLSAGLRNSMLTSTVADFQRQSHDYQLGTILASALYHAGKASGQERFLEKALLEAYNSADPSLPGLRQLVETNLQTPENVNLVSVAWVLASHISDLELRKHVCNQFMDRLQIPAAELAGACPSSAAGLNICPKIF
jgi:hypothetical protein